MKRQYLDPMQVKDPIILEDFIAGIVDPRDVAATIALRASQAPYTFRVQCSKIVYKRLLRDYFRGYLAVDHLIIPKWVAFVRVFFPKFGGRFCKKTRLVISQDAIDRLNNEYLRNLRILISGYIYTIEIL